MRRRVILFSVLLAVVVLASTTAVSRASLSVIQGTVNWYDQYGNLRPLPWAQVIAEGQSGEPTVASSATDGSYIMWVPPGTYNVTASLDPGYTPISYPVTVTPGGVAVVDFNLEPSGKPIPEYPSIVQPIMAVVAVLVAAIMIRRRRDAHLQHH